MLWVPMLSDKHCRKKYFILGIIGQLLSMTVMIFTHNLDVMIAAGFATGAISSFRVNVGFIYLMELMPKRY